MKKGQIWIETVIYTLIGLALIGIVLGFVKPAVDEKRDSVAVTSSIEMLNNIDGSIEEVRYVAGNSRPVEIKMSKGKMIVDSENDSIVILIEDSVYAYGQPGSEINASGNVVVLTTQKGNKYTIRLFLNYKDKLNIKYNGKESSYTFQKAQTPYKISITNTGTKNDLSQIDFSSLS
ncbi:hypothetical protein FJZ19_03010 [Candidatus Pacearchaeota archaeon]|nr:hypothetical protein [Candidatus Pacearchaeota archaeon]